MDFINLDEDSYDYNELLNLFSLPQDFNLTDLKSAKQKVLKLHPDKCKLDKKYFLFFLKMYRKLEQIYQFVHHEIDVNNLKSTIDINDHFKKFLEKRNIDPKTNYKAFSKEFNKMFDEVYIKDNESGYEKWLKSNDDIYDKDDIEASRKKAIAQQALIETRQDIEEVGGSNCDLFGKLKCFDVKESHQNSILAIDVEKEYAEKPKFRSVQEYQQFLTKEDETNVPFGLSQSKNLLKQRENMLNKQSKNMAYQAMKNNEKMNERYNLYISKHLQLEH